MFDYQNVSFIDRIPGGPGPEKDEGYHRVWHDFECVAYHLSMEELGLAFPRAGLVWFMPLCHDGLDY